MDELADAGGPVDLRGLIESSGIAIRPASRISVQNGIHFQI